MQHQAFNQEIVDYITSQKNLTTAEEHFLQYQDNYPHNQAFLIGFDQNAHPLPFASVESRKNMDKIFGQSDFEDNLTPNSHNNTTPEEVNACFNQLDQHQAGIMLKVALKVRPWDAESILVSQLLKAVIESGGQHPFTTLYIHTTLAPCDPCCETLQYFANLMQIPVYVTYLRGYKTRMVDGDYEHHIQAAGHNLFNLVFTRGQDGEPSVAIGEDASNQTYILTFFPQ